VQQLKHGGDGCAATAGRNSLMQMESLPDTQQFRMLILRISPVISTDTTAELIGIPDRQRENPFLESWPKGRSA
jgi:hypothetical protein